MPAFLFRLEKAGVAKRMADALKADKPIGRLSTRSFRTAGTVRRMVAAGGLSTVG
jgi:hypothetical protein